MNRLISNKIRAFFVFVMIPVITTFLYLALMASDRFESETKFIVKRGNDVESGISALGILAGGFSTSSEDALILQEYILSHDMMSHLNDAVKLRDMYSSDDIDIVSRMGIDSTADDFLKLYRKRVSVEFDSVSSVVTVKAQGFTPEQSRIVLNEIVKKSEEFINNISHDIAIEQLGFSDSMVSASLERVKAAKARISKLQTSYRFLDPDKESGSILGVIGNIESEISSAKTELLTLESYMNPGSHQLVSVKSRIEALERQLSEEKNRIAGTGLDSEALARVISEFNDAKLDMEFALEAYKASFASAEGLRIDAAKKAKNLVIISKPTLPENAKYPNILHDVGLVFMVFAISFGFISLVVATIKDHVGG